MGHSYGRGRTTSLPVDSSDQLPDVSRFADIIGLKNIVLTRRDQFARCLNEKMRAYWTGRRRELSGSQEVDRIVVDLEATGDGLLNFVLASDQRPSFRNK